MPKKISMAPDASADVLKNNTAIATGGAVVNFRDSWRIFKIMSEFVEGYQFLAGLKNEVTILGSARLPANSKYYQIAEDLGRHLAKEGFTVITGGGPGIMEAANKGAFEAGGESVGINIQLPFEQRINPFVKKSTAFYYFFTRKVMLTSPANAFVFFPGGFGTLDEFFEVVDAMELGHMRRAPIVLVDSKFWDPVVSFLANKSIKEVNSLSNKEMADWHIVETADEAMEYIKGTPDREEECAVDDLTCQGGLDWRLFRIMAELVEGFEFLAKIKNNVTVLGTKSILPGSSYYQAAYEAGKVLAQNKYNIITGGGPGTMEAANKGAFEASGSSYGINMVMKKNERRNNYLTDSIGFVFPFVRKLIITAPSKAFIFFPGGFGTLHQLFELLTMIETRKIEPVPLVLYGRAFWQPMLNIFSNLFAEFKTISKLDQHWVTTVGRTEDILPLLK